MAEQIQCRISAKLKNKVYELIAHENRDASDHEQMSIVLRVIDNTKVATSNYFIEEYLLDSVITSTIGRQDNDENEYYYRIYIDHQVIDNILVEFEDRFSSKNLEILSGISSLCPDSNTFLDFDSLKPIANHLNVDLQVLSNELMVVKPMLQNKSLTTIIDLHKELYRFQEVFPSLVTLI
ncbi:unnamed protein product [Rotaria sordida]|uniref:Uncharacterized protein n=1 Tax=Rotaria sordida TaxID=392033 RepID=A0A819NQK4_9BILA|nr:unnamed protein product [Rotaria sordida]CAF4001666.1 unnamed protein product [Rotaria sordida]CAF4069860.1 unnamed protein product [Rotaria sordida]